jgi:DNA modification methylase
MDKIDLSLPFNILTGDSRESLAGVPAGSVHCAVTSPPYFGLRSYKAGLSEIGRESTVTAYLDGLLAVFREVRRVLRDDGLLWVNLGTSYCTAKGSCYNPGGGADSMTRHADGKDAGVYPLDRGNKSEWAAQSYKPGDLIDIPSLFAEAMRLDGWYLRSRITWVKGVSCADDYSGSCMPESAAANQTAWVRHRVKAKPCEKSGNRASELANATGDPSKGRNPDNSRMGLNAQWRDCPGCAKCNPHGGYILKRGNGRPTNSTEVVLMFAKTGSYYYDAEAVKEKGSGLSGGRFGGGDESVGRLRNDAANERNTDGSSRCLRSAWWLPLENSTDSWFINPGGNSDVAGKHFAMFPMALPSLCIKQSTSERGVCPKCGAPWARVIERTAGWSKPCRSTTAAHQARGGVGEPVGHLGTAGGTRIDPQTRTIDWRPTCECGEADPIPATVLDPFSGMATTGVAALRLGRNYIGCELNEDYAQRSRERLDNAIQEKGLF